MSHFIIDGAYFLITYGLISKIKVNEAALSQDYILTHLLMFRILIDWQINYISSCPALKRTLQYHLYHTYALRSINVGMDKIFLWTAISNVQKKYTCVTSMGSYNQISKPYHEKEIGILSNQFMVPTNLIRAKVTKGLNHVRVVQTNQVRVVQRCPIFNRREYKDWHNENSSSKLL